MQRLLSSGQISKNVIGINLEADHADVLLGDEDTRYIDFKVTTAIMATPYGWKFDSSSLKVRCGSMTRELGASTVICSTQNPFVGLPQDVYDETVAKELAGRGLNCRLDTNAKFVTCRVASPDAGIFPDMSITVAGTGLTHRIPAEDLVEFVKSSER